MKKAILLIVAAFAVRSAGAQMAVVAPSLETQVALNHVEQIQQAVQTYETMVGVKQSIDKGIDVIEKVNSKLATIREVHCVNVTAYGAKVFSSGFLKMNDAERLNETRHVLDEIDKLLARVSYVDTQVNAIEFNNRMMNAYFH